MTARLTLPQAGRRIPLGLGQTILEAALAAGIAYPHSCRSGRCGACKSRLLQGSVELGTHTRFALSQEERDDGLILACRAVPEGDVTVAWLGDEDAVPDRPVVRQAARVTTLAPLTHDILCVRLALDDRAAFDFLPGQYVRVALDEVPERDYSIASLPGEELIELHVRRVPGGRTSAAVHERLRVGDQVSVEGPFGSAFLREAHSGPIIAVAGGSGLAPIRSIVESALRADRNRRIHLYFGARSAPDVYLREHFESLADGHTGLSYVPVLSQSTEQGWRVGMVSEALASDDLDLAAAKAYVAGPPAMVEAVTAVLRLRGLEPRDIHADVFFTPEQAQDRGP